VLFEIKGLLVSALTSFFSPDFHALQKLADLVVVFVEIEITQ